MAFGHSPDHAAQASSRGWLTTRFGEAKYDAAGDPLWPMFAMRSEIEQRILETLADKFFEDARKAWRELLDDGGIVFAATTQEGGRACGSFESITEQADVNKLPGTRT